MTISKLDSTNFKKFIENLIQVSEYCSSDKDLNAHVISIILLQYYFLKQPPTGLTLLVIDLAYA